jgi:Protein of unknown function (DUF3795)
MNDRWMGRKGPKATAPGGQKMVPKRAAPGEKPVKRYPTIGVCGLDCGLCPRYYTQGKSRCPGCAGPDFFNKHPSCSFITCCVKERGLEVCGECPDFPCAKFKTDREYQQLKESSSYPSYRVVMANLNFIKDQGIDRFIARQRKRMGLLQRMIEDFDDGRSRSFFCRAACRNDLTSLENSLSEAIRRIQTDNINPDDIKAKTRVLREILNQAALQKAVS